MPATITNPRLLTPAQVAERTGLHVKSVRRAIREGRIPARKISGRLFVNESAITAPADLDATEASTDEVQA